MQLGIPPRTAGGTMYVVRAARAARKEDGGMETAWPVPPSPGDEIPHVGPSRGIGWLLAHVKLESVGNCGCNGPPNACTALGNGERLICGPVEIGVIQEDQVEV